MQYINSSVEDFASYIKKNKKKIILFGAGSVCKTFVPYILNKFLLTERVLFVIDNNPSKQGTSICFGDFWVPIRQVDYLTACTDDFCIMITNGDFYSVMTQLNQIRNCDDKKCFIAAIMQLNTRCNIGSKYVWKDYSEPRIPKIINYCWFSGNPMPKQLINCIETWKEMCPDYDIVRWDETNFDVNRYRYTKEAYKMQKWGFIPDIVRLEILYECGGFYFDTDVKIVKNLEEMRYQDTFCGRERMGHVNFGGGSGSVTHSEVVKEILEFRKNEPFKLRNGGYNSEASGYYETNPLMKRGLIIEDTNQKLDGINVYASEFFSPYNYINGENIMSENTFSIHFFSGSWIESGENLRKETRDKYASIKQKLGELMA